MSWPLSIECVHEIQQPPDEHSFYYINRLTSAYINGNLDRIVYIAQLYPELITNTILKYAVTYGHLNVLEWQIDNFPLACEYNEMLYIAAENGHIHIVKHLFNTAREHLRTLDNTHRPNLTDVLNIAADNEYFDIVVYLLNNSVRCTQHVINCAAKTDNIALVEWLSENTITRPTKQGLMYAAANGNLEILEFLCEHYLLKCDSDVFNSAIINNRVLTAVWIHKHFNVAIQNHIVTYVQIAGYTNMQVFLISCM